MKPTTLNIFLRIFLICIVLDIVVIFFNFVLGVFIMSIAIVGLLFSGWKASKLLRVNPDAFRDQSRREKELGLKDLPSWLIILFVGGLIISSLGYFGLFSFYPLLDATLSLLAIVILVFYFLQKRKMQKRKVGEVELA